MKYSIEKMTHYSVQSRDSRLIKGYEFAKNMGRNVGKNIIKKLSSKYSQNLLHHAKTICYNALKTTSKRVIQKTAEATGDLIGNKTVDKLQWSRSLHHRIIQKQMKKKYLYRQN